MNIEHKFINLDERDYHMHTSTFSDGLSTLEELVKYAGDIGLKEIAITDHSDASLKKFQELGVYYPSAARWSLGSWGNVHNDTNVIFGVEGDILTESGECSTRIQGKEGDFLILSAHKGVYAGAPWKVTEATIKAMERYQGIVRFIAHPCNNADFGENYKIEALCEAANHFKIPLEVNAKNLQKGKTDKKKLHILLEKADTLYLNSDAHTLFQLRDARNFARQYLREHGYIS